MKEDLGFAWREEFIRRGYVLRKPQGDLEIGGESEARYVNVTFEKQEHKLTELCGATEEFLEFRHGHIVSTYHWSQVLGVHVFRA
jgi:hypothetical protein